MPLKAEKSADLAQILPDVGEPIARNGRTCRAIITALDFSETLQISSSGADYDFTVKIAKEALGSARSKLKRSRRPPAQMCFNAIRKVPIEESESMPIAGSVNRMEICLRSTEGHAALGSGALADLAV